MNSKAPNLPEEGLFLLFGILIFG